jgi:hypothetical protein
MQATFDASLYRVFRVTEHFSAEARAEIYNLFNRNNYLQLNNIYGEGPLPRSAFLAPVAGLNNVDPSRQLQFGVRLLF